MTCAAVHARLDDLERDLALHGLGLLGHVDDAHAALADLLQELVWANDRARAFAEGDGGLRHRGGSVCLQGQYRLENRSQDARQFCVPTEVLLQVRRVAPVHPIGELVGDTPELTQQLIIGFPVGHG